MFVTLNFVKGLSRIDAANLFDVTSQILTLIASFDMVFVSHINSHSNVSCENDLADALCTWSLSTKQQLSRSFSHEVPNLIPLLRRPNTNHTPPASSDCPICRSTNHKVNVCPFTSFMSNFSTRQRFPPCLVCLSCEHESSKCALMALPTLGFIAMVEFIGELNPGTHWVDRVIQMFYLGTPLV